MANMENTYFIYKRTIGALLNIEDELIGSDAQFETAIGIAALAAYNTKTRKLMEKYPDLVENATDDEIEVFYYIVTRGDDMKPVYATEMYFRMLNNGAN